MSRSSPSKEQSWSQLQEKLLKIREKQQQTTGSSRTGQKNTQNASGRKSIPPNPLPSLGTSVPPDNSRWSSPELRGSHFPRVPPVSSTQRILSDDTLSLDSYNSDNAPQDLFEPQLAPPQPTSPPYLPNGSSHHPHTTTHTQVPSWDQYTGRRRGTETREIKRRGKKKYYVRQGTGDFDSDIQDVIHANHMQIMDMNRGRYHDNGVHGEGGPQLVELDSVFGGKELVRIPAHRQQEPEPWVYMQDELFARTFLEYFLTSCLQDDMVLEVALDVMADIREERDLERKLSRPVLDVAGEILDEVVTENLRDVAFIEYKTTVRSYWLMLSNSPMHYKPVARELLQEVVHEEASAVVSESVSELVAEYFIQKEVVADYNGICDDVMAVLIPDIIVETLYEESVEFVVQEIIDAEIVSVASSFLENVFTTGRPKLPMSPEVMLRDEDEIKNLAEDFLLDLAIFDSLLTTRSIPNQQVWSQDEFLDLYLDSLILDQVLGQQLEVVKRRDATEDCLPLKRFHEKICTNVALDTLLHELIGHLDEDMADLDEYEMEIDHPVTFDPP